MCRTIQIDGKRHSLWRAVDQEIPSNELSECIGYGDVVDVYLQARRYGAAAKRFFKRLLRSRGDEPGKIVIDKLRSYGVARRVEQGGRLRLPGSIYLGSDT